MLFVKNSQDILRGSIFDLNPCYLCLSDIFYFNSICIKGPKTKLSIFFSYVLVKEVGKKSRQSLCIKHRDSFLKNTFVMLSDFVEGGLILSFFVSFNKEKLTHPDKKFTYELFVLLIYN